MGIRDQPTAYRSPWQNGHTERLIGSVWRECTDCLVAFYEGRLRRILVKYATYYNEMRTHVSLGKRCTLHALDRADWRRCRASDLRRATSSVRSTLNFGSNPRRIRCRAIFQNRQDFLENSNLGFYLYAD